MESHPLDALAVRQAGSGTTYLEFLRRPSMSLGLYVLGPGATDEQSPHTEDEAYVVLAGQARFTAGDEVCDVGAGDTLFVPAGMPHHFHDITTELRLVVVFAPPEGSLAPR
jgi:mannose-6-phosphate isomerase-like protein (cupin superfamily)